MSGRSSPAGGGGSGSGGETASLRLSVRKDLFPDREQELTPPSIALDDLGVVSCVKLETDFEQSIDDIAHAKRAAPNGLSEKKHRSGKKRKRKRRSPSPKEDSNDSDSSPLQNGLPEENDHRRRSPRDTRIAQDRTKAFYSVKSGKNLSLVSSSERENEDCTYSGKQKSKIDFDSDDDSLQSSVPLLRLPASGGKPFSHTLSQLSNKKKKTEKKFTPVPLAPCSGKPRSMLGIVASHSKKKSSKRSHLTTTYQSQIVDTNTIKIKIKKANIVPQIRTPVINNVPPKKNKKKKTVEREVSESSGEEYDPSQGDTPASISVAAPKPRSHSTRHRKETVSKKKRSTDKAERGDSNRASKAERISSSSSQSAWGRLIPVTVLIKIFEYVINVEGTLPTAIRLGRVCRLWHSVACLPVLWRHVELSPHTRESSKTDLKLIALLQHRLNKCLSLNLAHWKVSNIGCMVACLVDYCPGLQELNLTGWTRLTAEHLLELAQGLTKLARIDLSLTSEMGASGTCLSAACMAQFTETMGERLTHLSLSNNMFTALQQILTSIATHCPNLEVLDMSGARATSHPALVPLESLQRGCRKLRVLRAANAQILLASASTQQQMESEGFPCLEELSIAAGTGGSGVGEYRLDDDALGRIVRGATKLRLLDVRGLTRISDSGLVRVPAWDLQHLFLGSCKLTQQNRCGLDLVCEKWAHSLLEVDLAWASASRPLDAAVEALADKGPDSKLRILNLCGSSVSFEAVKKVLLRCLQLESINLSSCRALPRGMKRLYTGKELQELKNSLDPARANTNKREETKHEKRTDAKSESANESTLPEKQSESSQSSSAPAPSKLSEISSPPKTPTVETAASSSKDTPPRTRSEPIVTKETVESVSNVVCSPVVTSQSGTVGKFSPSVQTGADSSSAPVTEKPQTYPRQSPVQKPDTQTPSDEMQDVAKVTSPWNLNQFKTTPTHKSEASPVGKLESNAKGKQCSPITSVDCKPSPEPVQAVKQDIRTPNHWNYGNYSPMPRQDGQYSSHNSPYSAQPSPAQPSPYSAQPSPYSTQPSPYSSQQSPYSQPSPDTSQIVKPDIQKNSASWNLGPFSPMAKPTSQYSPHPSSHASPDPGTGVKPDVARVNTAKVGQFSPASRGLSQDRHHRSPYSPRSALDSPVAHANKKSPAASNFSPMMRAETQIRSPEGVSHLRPLPAPEHVPLAHDPAPLLSNADLTAAAWALEGFLQEAEERNAAAADISWASPGFPAMRAGPAGGALPAQHWGGVPGGAGREEPVRWAALDEFAADAGVASFLDQSLAMDVLSSHQFIDESYAESRAD